MKTIESLKITTFFPVEHPKGILQRNCDTDNYSVGIDLAFPEPTEQFMDAIIQANSKYYNSNLVITQSTRGDWEIINRGNKLIEYNKEHNFYSICSNLTIPTGVGFDIPKHIWFEVRTKSGNFGNKFQSIHGVIDMNYTYGIGVQLIPIDDIKLVVIKPGQGFAQVIAHEGIPVMNIEHLHVEEFEKLESVKNKRDVRTGGFGSTGESISKNLRK